MDPERSRTSTRSRPVTGSAGLVNRTRGPAIDVTSRTQSRIGKIDSRSASLPARPCLAPSADSMDSGTMILGPATAFPPGIRRTISGTNSNSSSHGSAKPAVIAAPEPAAFAPADPDQDPVRVCTDPSVVRREPHPVRKCRPRDPAKPRHRARDGRSSPAEDRIEPSPDRRREARARRLSCEQADARADWSETQEARDRSGRPPPVRSTAPRPGHSNALRQDAIRRGRTEQGQSFQRAQGSFALCHSSTGTFRSRVTGSCPSIAIGRP